MSLAKTYLQDLRVKYPSNLDRDELRLTRHGLLMAVMAMTVAANSIVDSDLREKALKSEGRKLDVPVMTKDSVTINNTRSCTIACDESNSDFVTVIWKTLSFDVCMTPAQYEKNEIKYLTDLNKKIRERVEATLSLIETDIDTQLDTAKSQIYNSPIVADKYPLVGNALQVAGPDNRKLFYNDIDPINFEDDFYDEDVYIVASPSLMSDVRYYINQGGANNENLAWQFNGKNFTFSNRITNTKTATGYFMPNGSIGFLTRVDVTARMGAKAGDGTEWFTDTLAGLPFPVGVQYKSKCENKTGLNGGVGMDHLTSTLEEKWQFSFDYAIVLPYNSDIATKASSIRKFEVSATVAAP